MRFAILLFCVSLSGAIALAQTSEAGRQSFVSRCAGCHGSDGNGGELGPGITTRVPARTDDDLKTLLRQGLPTAGMPAFPSLSDTETADLIRYVRTLRPRSGTNPVRATVATGDGRRTEGLVLNQTSADLQLIGDDRTIHLFSKQESQYRAVQSQADRPTSHGTLSGSRTR